MNPSRKRAKASESAIPVATTVVAEPVRPTADAKEGQSAAPTHVLVDWENVQPKDQDIQTLVPPVTDVWLFHGPSQKNVSADQALFGQRATLVPIARAGKNALDFHLSFYMGYIASRSPQANFVVISNDKGYLPMLEHAQSLGFSARQIGFVKAHAAVKKVAPGKTRAKAPTIGLSAIAKESSAKTASLTRQQKVHAPMAAKRPAAVKTAPLTPRVTQASSKKAVQTAEPAPVKKTAPVNKAPAARKTQASGAATPAPAKRSNQRQRPASQVPKARNIAGIAEFLTARRIAAPPPEAHAPEIRKQPSLTFDLDKAVRHVQASLQRSANKPTRKARLLAAVTSLLNESSSDAAIVTDVLAKLVSRGFVRLDEKGGVHFNP
ncbi:PIN domain-containing protein [Rhodoferax ferrireducens]|uniref:PIN domain-containing protein n=1 Tax=Rhodoferax ferrireducens TaxID=192843 RepID=UPI003BB7A03F